MVQEKENSTLKYALHYGVFLGLYWMLEYTIVYIVINSGFAHLFAQYLMSIGTFLLIYNFILKYKGSLTRLPSLLQYIIFAISMSVAASIFEGALMYAHFKFIDPGYFLQLSNQTKEIMMTILDKMPNLPKDEIQINNMILSKGYYITSLFINNIILGGVIGFISGVLLNSNLIKDKR